MEAKDDGDFARFDLPKEAKDEVKNPASSCDILAGLPIPDSLLICNVTNWLVLPRVSSRHNFVQEGIISHPAHSYCLH